MIKFFTLKYDPMKSQKGLIILLSSLWLSSYATHYEKSSFFEKLCEVNIQWKVQNKKLRINQNIPLISNDITLIQTHLSLVEAELRQVDTRHLSSSQKEKRKHCLDYLHDYTIKGQFPVNTFHTARTPYFIDNYGTACAVGHLIIRTGNKNLAYKISRENNYAYILDLKYSEIHDWAREYGFSVHELAWIQPSYINPNYGDTSCVHEAELGVFGPKKATKYLWSNGDTTKRAKNLCPKKTYKVKAWDSSQTLIPDTLYSIISRFGQTKGDSTTLGNIIPFYVHPSSTPDDGRCNGTATASIYIAGDTFGIRYYWSPINDTNRTARNLCEGWYRVTVVKPLDGMLSASTMDSVKVTKSIASVKDFERKIPRIFPNPTRNQCAIELPSEIPLGFIQINSNSGKTVYEKELSSSSQIINLSSLSEGIYFYRIICKQSQFHGHIVKMN